MPSVTTHILDLVHGCPAAAVSVCVYFIQSETKKEKLNELKTNQDGRVDEPLVRGADFKQGEYELLYNVGEYFGQKGVQAGEPPFLTKVSVRVALSAAEAHYHIPLLISPWGYQVYRGS